MRLALVVALTAAGRMAEAASGITVNGTLARPARDLALSIAGCGVRVADIRYTGAVDAAGTFNSVNTGTIGFNSGLVLTTGSIVNIPGPNRAPGAGADNMLPGDPDLDALLPSCPNCKTHDATVLEFDFVPDGGTIYFDCVFASEHYNEFVGSPANDVFGFFLNGKNVAVLPGNIPVSINTVNAGNRPCCSSGTTYQNDSLYICNTAGSCTYYRWSSTRFEDLEMDGLTIVLSVTAPVVPNEYNHIRFAIADAGDAICDSAVFIRAGSFRTRSCVPSGTSYGSTMSPAASGFSAFPNPWRPGSGGVQEAARIGIRSVPLGGKVRIYTTEGALVTELTDSGGGVVWWNGRNAHDRDVGSGVYIAVAEPPGGGSKVRTRMVIVR